MSGNVTCVQQPAITWWLNSVGENPCQSYERLIRVCEAGYTMLDIPLPPVYTICTGTKCCCSSVAYSLASACWSCQWGPQASASNPASLGVYFSNSCNKSWQNGRLLDEVEQSIRPVQPAPWAYIPLTLDGIWSYLGAEQNASAVLTSSASIPSTSSVSTTSTSTTSTTPLSAISSPGTTFTSTGTDDLASQGSTPPADPSNTFTSIAASGSSTGSKESEDQNTGTPSGSNTPLGVISGVAIGVLALVFLFLVVWFIRRRRRRNANANLPELDDPQDTDYMLEPSLQPVPFIHPDVQRSSPNSPTWPYTPHQMSPSSPIPTSPVRSTPRARTTRKRKYQRNPVSSAATQQQADDGAVPYIEDSIVLLPPSYDSGWGSSRR